MSEDTHVDYIKTPRDNLVGFLFLTTQLVLMKCGTIHGIKGERKLFLLNAEGTDLAWMMIEYSNLFNHKIAFNHLHFRSATSVTAID